MPEVHERQLGFNTVLVDHLKERYKNLKKQNIHNIFIKTN